MSQIDMQHLIWGVQIAGVVRSALELRVFDHLHTAGTARADEVAHAIVGDPRATRILLDALTSVGLVLRDDDALYRLSPMAASFLVSDSPKYVGDMMQMLQTQVMWQTFERLTDAVRAGGTVLEAHAEDPTYALWESFATHTMGLARRGGAALTKLLEERLALGTRLEVLDVACGTGLYGRSVADRFEHARVTFLDWARVLDKTRSNVAALVESERARFLPGDMFEVALNGPYDLIIASHVFHHFDEARSAQLLARLSGSLRAGGLLAIHDFMVSDESPAVDPAPHLFATTMLASTRHGESYERERYLRLLEQAGFGPIEERQVGRMPTRFLLATRHDD